jgi:hypothetical protein
MHTALCSACLSCRLSDKPRLSVWFMSFLGLFGLFGSMAGRNERNQTNEMNQFGLSLRPRPAH